jgi:hypothetical protein
VKLVGFFVPMNITKSDLLEMVELNQTIEKMRVSQSLNDEGVLAAYSKYVQRVSLDALSMTLDAIDTTLPQGFELREKLLDVMQGEVALRVMGIHDL